jgi:hypothetical protein
VSGYYPGPGYRDQFTPAQEREMDERERWEEDNCDCVDDASERTCRVHGDPEVVGMSREDS